MKIKKILSLLLITLLTLGACTPQQGGMADEDYYAEVLAIEPKIMAETILLPLMLFGLESGESQADLQRFVDSQRATWERVAALDYRGRTFASSHRLLQDMAQTKMGWIDRMEEAIPKGTDAVSLVLGELVSQAGEYEAYDAELKRNEDASEWTTDQNGAVIAKADVVEATDEELAADDRYLYLKKKAKGIDKDIRIFIDDEKENTLVLTYKEPADSRITGDEHLELLNYFVGLIEGATPSSINQRGDFRMEVTFE